MEKIHKEILGLMGKIDINCRDEGDVIVIELSGQLDIYNSGDLSRLIEAYMQRGFHKYVVNLEKVSYWDSSTLSVFINCMRNLEELKGKFLLACLQGAPREVFEMAKLDQVFSVYPTVGQALEAAGMDG